VVAPACHAGYVRPGGGGRPQEPGSPVSRTVARLATDL